MAFMSPSDSLFLDRDEVYESRRAKQRARWLYEWVSRDVDEALSPPRPPGPGQEPADAQDGHKHKHKHKRKRKHEEKHKDKLRARPFPRWRESAGKELISLSNWHIVAEVAEEYPKLLVWLTEGQVRRHHPRNVFAPWIAAARLIPGLRWLLWHFIFMKVARRAPWRPALYEAILQQRLRSENRGEDRAGRTTRDSIPKPEGFPGLSAVSDVAVIMPTSARDELRDKIVSMKAGCIGVSGLRGSGKTTLIQDFCSHRYGTPRNLPDEHSELPVERLPGLRVMVEAPLRFDARDFLIHLYTCLCRTVLTDVRFNTATLTDQVLGTVLVPRRIRLTALFGSLSALLLLALSAGLARQAYGWRLPGWGHAHMWEAIGALASLIAAMIAVGWRTRRTLIEIRQVVNLAADAEQRLQWLHYLRTSTRSAGASLSGPAGAGVSIGSTQELAEQAITLPELIDDYRDFVRRVVAALIEVTPAAGQGKQAATSRESNAATDVRLIIGIDQMDQIDDQKAASMFLNELSAVFGTPGCVYLLAVAPGTLAAVDQRTVPLKTNSGGLFDEMVWVEPLTLPKAAELLDSRARCLPTAFIALCYVLSGGLPRELLRIARTVFSTPADEKGQISLAAAVAHVIDGEYQALRHRAMASAASLDVAATPAWLRRLPGAPWQHHRDYQGIQAVMDDLRQQWTGKALRRPHKGQQHSGKQDQDPDFTALSAEIHDCFVAGLYFLLTVYDLFATGAAVVSKLAVLPVTAQETAEETAEESGTRTGTESESWLNEDPPVLLDLADARAALGVSPYVASIHIDEARLELAAASESQALAPLVQLPFIRARFPSDQTGH
jgi:hypothetical protein